MDPELRLQRLKSVDYAALRKKTDAIKASGEVAAMKMKEVVAFNKAGKDNSLIKQHKLIWNQEFNRLTCLRQKLTKELETQTNAAIGDPELRQLFIDFDSFSDSMTKERENFKAKVIDPTFSMCEDLRYFVQCKNQGGPVPATGPIKNILGNIQEELERTRHSLMHHENALAEELQTEGLSQLTNPEPISRVQTGIPEEAWDLVSPDADLKADLLQEYLLLDSHFQSRLERLQTIYPGFDVDNLPLNWSREDSGVFETFLDGYLTFCTTNRHTMTLDLLKRVLPHKPRQQLLDMEHWLTSQRSYREQLRSLASDWTRDRRELSNRVKVTLMEAQEALAKAAASRENATRQQEICELLCERVRAWQMEKREVMQVEDRLMDATRARIEEHRRAEMERESKKREREKDRIRVFRERVNQEREQMLQEEEARLAEKKKELMAQAARDKERVDFRDQQYLTKLEEFKDKEVERLENDNEREKRLEALRNKVRPIIEFDPGRLIQDTESWKHHSAIPSQFEDDRSVDPLGDSCGAAAVDTAAAISMVTRGGMYTFSDHQIMSDPRTRAELAFRSAGLMHNTYARDVVSHLAPAQAPRKDSQLSNKDFLKHSDT